LFFCHSVLPYLVTGTVARTSHPRDYRWNGNIATDWRVL
jgi:hypothetical protein